jgi:hypothetical protein
MRRPQKQDALGLSRISRKINYRYGRPGATRYP